VEQIFTFSEKITSQYEYKHSCFSVQIILEGAGNVWPYLLRNVVRLCGGESFFVSYKKSLFFKWSNRLNPEGSQNIRMVNREESSNFLLLLFVYRTVLSSTWSE
jgi:hypothetical protein